MKTVRVMKIVSHDESQLRSLDELMRVFGSAKRYAFNRLLEGRNAKEIIKHVPHQFRLNKRYAEDVVLLAQSLISSQRELLPMRLEDVQAKIEKNRKENRWLPTWKKNTEKSRSSNMSRWIAPTFRKAQSERSRANASSRTRDNSTCDFWWKTKLLQALERKNHERRMERFAFESVVRQRR